MAQFASHLHTYFSKVAVSVVIPNTQDTTSLIDKGVSIGQRCMIS